MKNIIWILSLLAMCLISSVFLFKCNNPFKKKIESIKQEQNIKQDQKQIQQIREIIIHDTVESKKDKNGVIHSISSVAVGNYNQMKTANKALAKMIDSQANIIGIQRKQIETIINEHVKASGDITSYSHKTKSGYYKTYFNDCFLNGYTIRDTIRNSKERLVYSGNVKLTGVRYWKRPHKILWGAIKWGFPIFKDDIHTNCPNVVVDSIQEIKLEKKNFISNKKD